MELYCPSCDRTFSEADAVSEPPFRKCPICSFTLVSHLQTREGPYARIDELERQVAAMQPLVQALAAMPYVQINGSPAPCPWCLGRGSHAEECPVTLAQHVEAASRA
jgi:hypothetical protein